MKKKIEYSTPTLKSDLMIANDAFMVSLGGNTGYKEDDIIEGGSLVDGE